MVELRERIKEYGLQLNEDKTKMVNFDKLRQKSFNFLGSPSIEENLKRD
jgi:hypothetical protein